MSKKKPVREATAGEITRLSTNERKRLRYLILLENRTQGLKSSDFKNIHLALESRYFSSVDASQRLQSQDFLSVF